MTVFLALLVCLLLVLVLALLESARLSVGRWSLLEAGEAAAESLTAGYQRETYEAYGLLFYDASFGGGTPDSTRMEEEFALWFGKNAGGPFFSVQAEEVQVKRLLSACDYSGAVFQRSAERLVWLQMEGEDRRLRLEESAERRKRLYCLLKEGAAAYRDITPYAEEEEEAAKTTAGRLLAAGAKLREIPLLTLVKPASAVLSGTPADMSCFPSRTSRDGRPAGDFSLEYTTEALGEEEKRELFLCYLDRFFPCFTEQDGKNGLSLEAEYLLFSGETDEENLENALWLLFSMLQGLNRQILLSSAGRMQEIRALSAEYQDAGGSLDGADAELAGILAYAESVKDLKCLLEGGRLPQEKTEADWRMGAAEVEGLLLGSFPAFSKVDDGRETFSYKEALQALYLDMDSETLSYRAMDMIQENMNTVCSGFLMSSQVFEIEAEVTAVQTALFTRQPFMIRMTDRTLSLPKMRESFTAGYRQRPE